MPKVRKPKTDGYLNVDLEIGARTLARLAPLLEAFDGKLIELFRGRIRSLYRAHYESRLQSSNPSATIRQLVAVIEGLSRPARNAWDAAEMRDFNVGVELASGVHHVELAIDPDAIRQVARLGGRIAFTTYRGE